MMIWTSLSEKVKANISFIAIVGMGRIAKTILVKSLYSDKQVYDCFNLVQEFGFGF